MRFTRCLFISLGLILPLSLSQGTPGQSPKGKSAAKNLPRVSADQIHRPEWLNKEIEVEDRISNFEKQGNRYEIIKLKGSSVPLVLPAQLRLDRPSPLPRGRFTGRVVKIGRVIEFMVSTMEFLPSESEELASKVAALRPDDAQKRLEIASWADSIAARYKDRELTNTVVRLRTEAYKIIGSQPDPPGSRPGSAALAAADEAQKAGADTATVQALAHLGFFRAYQGIRDQAGLEQLSREIARLLPDSTKQQNGKLDNSLKADFEKEPLPTYLKAKKEDRRLFDRQLMINVLEKGLMMAVTNNPGLTESLVDTARRALPERPDLPEAIRNQGLPKMIDQAEKLGRDDLITLINQVRDKFGQAELARQIARKWLDNRQAKQLADGDTEGRFSIAQDYLALLGDRRSAASLFRECLSIDPDMQKAADALAALGWKKEGDRWIDPDSVSSETPASPSPGSKLTTEMKPPEPNLPGGRVGRFPAPPTPNQPNLPTAATDSDSMAGMTREQVKARMGDPEHKSRVATQGQLVELWQYETPRGRQIVQFMQKSAKAIPTVKAVYVLSK